MLPEPSESGSPGTDSYNASSVATDRSNGSSLQRTDQDTASPLQSWLYPEPEELSDDFQMPIWDHLDELRERVLVAALAALVAVLACFAFSKDLVVFLEAPVASQGVRFLQLSPGEFFFTTLQVTSFASACMVSSWRCSRYRACH